MTSATARRVAKLEGALPPREAVLAWLAEAQQFPSIVDHARAIADLPVEAAPLSVIGARVVAAVRADLKGQSRDAVERAALRAQGDAVFLFCLVVILNGRVHEVAQLEGLRASCAFFWMGALLGGPHEPPTSEEDAKEQRDAWRSWRTLTERLTTDVRVETEARASLQRRYLGGYDVLFADVATDWAKHVEFIERLAGFAEVMASAETETPARRKPSATNVRATFEGRAGALASQLADDARVKAYEILGERERAVSIMERRLRD
jgi:hypothetical protein